MEEFDSNIPCDIVTNIFFFPGYFLKKMSNPLCRIKVYLIRTFYDTVMDTFSDWVIPGEV